MTKNSPIRKDTAERYKNIRKILNKGTAMSFDKKDPKQWFMLLFAIFGLISLILWGEVLLRYWNR